MAFLKMVLGTVFSIIAFIIAVKLLALLLAIVGLALKLLWLAIVVGGIALVAYVVYRIISPRPASQP
ncbi:MAG TPA: hypothetical protein VNO70_27285 [Blastocatellia bacterium]|nr:hypothetical protein [Blastocatellia bacterium]